jgi:hypothetical protein
MAYEDWSALDDEALEETAAAAPDSLTEQQRLLLGQYHIDQTTKSEPVTDLGIANPRESANNTDPLWETDWAELDEEALDEAAAAPEESLTEQQRLCLARRIESQAPIELEDEAEAEAEVDDEAEAEIEIADEAKAEIKDEDEEPQTSVPNAKTDQNVLWQEDELQILCPWKKWIYDEDNSIAIVQGDGYLKKASSRSSMLRRDVTEILKTREFLNRNPHLTDKHEQSTLDDYSRAHLYGYRRSMCQLRGPSPLRQVSTIDMSCIKIIFDRLNRTRKVSAWQHQWNRSQPRMRSPLRQFSSSDPEEALTTEDSSINLLQSKDLTVEVVPTTQAPEETVATAPDTSHLGQTTQPETITAL